MSTPVRGRRLLIQSTSTFRRLWHDSAPARGFQAYVSILFILNFSYMYYFCRHFGFSRRLAILHLSTVAGPTFVLILLTGLFVLLSRQRSRGLVRLIVASAYAGWITVLALLYAAHFAGNSLWGNNVNYQIVSHFLLRRRLQEYDGVSLSSWVYVVLALAATTIAIVHFVLSRQILEGLEHVFVPDRRSSIFHGRRRALTSAVAFVLMLTAYGAYVYALPGYVSDEWNTELEPIISFFQLDLYDMSHTAVADRLRVEEPRVRADYRSGRTFARKNVIVIIVDSLRPDHMQIYGYGRPTTPFLATLAQAGKLRQVEFATSTCAESKCGILSTLASKTLPRIVPEDFKLHDLLHDQGYSTYFILSGDHEWYGLKRAYGKDITYYLDNTLSDRYRGIADDRIILEGLKHVPDYGRAPAFFYFHLMSVHIAGVKQEQFRVYQPADVGYDWDALVHGNYDVPSLVNNYDNGVTQADATIRQIFEALERKGYLDQSIAVILADHGEGLGERGPKDFGHVKWLYQEFIRIPLVFYDDSGPSLVNLKDASQIDVAPTIVDRLGLPVPTSWEGQSLLRSSQRQYTFQQTSLINPSYSVIYRPTNAIYQYLYRRQEGREELYELQSDPLEKKNVMAVADQTLIRDLRLRLEEYRTQH